MENSSLFVNHFRGRIQARKNNLLNTHTKKNNRWFGSIYACVVYVCSVDIKLAQKIDDD